MPVARYETIKDTLTAINRLLVTEGPSLPEDVRDALIEISGQTSAVDTIAQGAEFFYANAEFFSAEAKMIGAAVAAFATMNGWHGLGEEGRGFRIVQSLQRDAGEPAPAGFPWPSADADPLPKPEQQVRKPEREPSPADQTAEIERLRAQLAEKEAELAQMQPPAAEQPADEPAGAD